MLDVKAHHRFNANFTLDATFATTARHVGLYGRSGSGKTALLNLIAGITRQKSATVRFDGDTWIDSASHTQVPLRERHVGYMTQDPLLFPHMTVEANLRYSRAGAGAGHEFDRVVDALRLQPFLERMPRNLSGGEQHRVALGRALLSQPRLLLLDEPFVGLDDVTRREAIALLLEVREAFDVPSVVVSHDGADLVALTDEVLVLEHGNIAAQGEPLECLADHASNPQSLAHRLDNLLRGTWSVPDAGRSHVAFQWGDVTLSAPSPQNAAHTAIYGCYAHSIMLSNAELRGQSARNHLRGTVCRLDTCGSTCVVTVDVGHATVRALITESALQEFQLRAGSAIWLSLKATSLAPLN